MVEPGIEPRSNDILNQILTNRGILWQDLSTNVNDLPDEALLPNIEAVADRISRAMFRNEPLVIFGHDDPDGITSTYILYQFFNTCGYQKHNYFIPNRNIEPHGIQQGFVDFVQERGFSLAITVDNGIASYDGVEKLKQLGCDTIIVDHHLIQPEQLPQAYAILNPQLPESQYPYKMLAGVGVVLMLIRYLATRLDHAVPPSAYFWASVGSIADKVPMNGLNRIVVRHAIENWEAMNDPSLEFLLRNNNRIDSPTDVFNFMQTTARLIANGREERGQHTAMRFLLEQGDAKAQLFQQMEGQRRKWESELNRVFSFLDTITAGFEGNAFIYFDDEDVIPYSLLGTAATYVLGKLDIPTIMLKVHNDDIVCEGRCGEGFNMVEAFRHCKDFLKQYGGHVRAAGFTLETANYDGFLECYNRYLNENPSAISTGAAVADAEAYLDELDPATWESLEILLPFGQQNPEPQIRVRNTNLDALQQHFNIEHGSAAQNQRGNMDAILSWRGIRSVRVLAWTECGTMD